LIKIIKIHLLLLLFLSNCSIDTNNSFWDNNKSKKKFSELKFDYSLSYDEFKKNAIAYGKISVFPKLDN